jgi:hypothetical protein
MEQGLFLEPRLFLAWLGLAWRGLAFFKWKLREDKTLHSLQ